MKRLLGVRQYKLADATDAPLGTAWRRVPKLNVIPGAAKGISFPWFLSGILILVFLWELFLLQNWYMAKRDSESTTRTANTELRTVQTKLSAGQNELDGLRTQITQLQDKLGQANEANRTLTSQVVDWSGGLSQLFDVGAQGIALQSVESKAGGELVVVAVFKDAKTMAEFQNQIQKASQVFDVQNISWEGTQDSYTFTATLKVKP